MDASVVLHGPLYGIAGGDWWGYGVYGGDYARQSVSFTRSGSTVSNTAAVEFPVSTADRDAVTAVGIFDALTSGNLVAYKVFPSSKQYNTGQSLKFLAGDLSISLD